MKLQWMACLTAILCACSRPVPMATPSMSSAASASETEISNVIIQALQSEAGGLRADSLYSSSANIVVNGRTRTLSPLFAGIGPGGQVAISSSQLEIRQGTAWGVVAYRWEMADVAREGQATFILAQAGGGRWVIQHAHSSSPR